jgi:hypothetical protein
MQFRRVLLRLMLWCLGLAALCGASAVLFAAGETIGRVIGTLATTAVAAALIMAASMLSEKKWGREAGLLAMGLLILEWVAALALIWEAFEPLSLGWSTTERVVVSMFFAAGSVVWAMIMLIFLRRPELRVAGWCGLRAAVVVTLLWALGVWWPSSSQYGIWSRTGDNLGGTAGTLALAGIVATILLVDFSSRRWWVWLSLACTAVAAAAVIIAIWLELHESNGAIECIISVAVVGAVCTVLRLVRLPGGQQLVVSITMALLIMTAVLVDAMILLEKQEADIEMAARLAAASGILAGCGILATLVLARLSRGDLHVSEMPVVESMTIFCPLCRRKQKMRVGESRCIGCGLIVQLGVREPRCECGYLLLMLKEPRCPECGRSSGGGAAPDQPSDAAVVGE